MSTWLVTGAAGFIGSNFVRQLLEEEPGAMVIGFDALSYAGNLENLEDCQACGRFRFVRGDICDPQAVREVLGDGVEVLVNFAAETHVDRSIMGCGEFIRTNVQGVQVLLDETRRGEVGRFVQVSTDEVYGSLGPTGKFSETGPRRPNSPYSASKAAADMLVLAYHHTYGLPGVVTCCSNNYGPYQFPEKLIPLFITNLLEGRKVPLYGDGLNIRDWIHVSDHCRAIRLVARRGRPGEVYNVGGNNERSNLEITRLLLELLGQDESMIQPVPDRPGHDRRYAVDTGKIEGELGWRPRVQFEAGLAETVAWYQANQGWWRRVKNKEYLAYYARQYAHA
ncbi:MAG: dTDP-glucose 4,6-dehydratase [Candidatus Thorarchaeota archaeon]|nr:dTDP-glucose 4,6-dehydratase [Candidatus Thorarchaeota archaeon]